MRGSSIKSQLASPFSRANAPFLTAIPTAFSKTGTNVLSFLIGLIALFLFADPGTVWGQCNPAGNMARFEYTINPTTTLNISGQPFCNTQGNGCCGMQPSYSCLDLVFNLENGPMGEQFGENCQGVVNLMTAQGNFDALFFAVGAPDPAGSNITCGNAINLGNNYTISVTFSGNGMGDIVAELTLLNNMGMPVFNATQTANPGEAVIFTLCKPGNGCVEDEIVFGCCDAAATLALAGPDTYCAGDSTTLKLTGFNGTPPYTVTMRAASATDTSYFDVVIPDDLDGDPSMDMVTLVVKPTDTTTYCAISVEDATGCVQPVMNDTTVNVNPVPEITLTISGPDNATCGDIVEITVESTSGFDDLAALQYSVNWNETELEYLSHTALQIGGGDPNIGIANALSNGELTYSWSAPGSGATLADGTVLLTLSMQVLVGTGNVTADLTGTPLAFEVGNEAFCIGTVIPQNEVDIAIDNIDVTCPDDFLVCTSALPLDLTTLGVSPAGGVFSGNGVTGNFFSADAGSTTTITYTYTDGTCTNTCTFGIAAVATPIIDPINDQTVCVGDNVAQINFSSNVPGTVFAWTRTPEAIGLAPTAGGNAVPAFSAANAGNAPLTSTFTVTASFTMNGLTCVATPINFDLAVNPTPSADPVADQTVCNGAFTTAIGFSGPVDDTEFAWTNNNPTIGLAAAGTGDIPAFAAVNNTNAPVTATITVTPTYTNDGEECSGAPIVFTITVNPTPAVLPVGNQLVCSGDATADITFTGTVPGTVFDWVNSTPAIGLAPNGTGDIAAFIAQNPGNTPLVATITVTPTYTNNGVTCTGTPIVFTITADPRPTVFAGFDQTICENQTALLVATLGGGATSGTWSGGAGTFANPNAPTTTYTPNPAEYGSTVTLTFTTNDPAGPCPAVSDDLNVTINTSPIVNAGKDVMICQNENLDMSQLGASILANGSGVTTGTWSTSGTGTFQPNNLFPPGATTYIPSAADRLSGAVVLTLTSADPAGPCASVADQAILSFLPLDGLTCNDNVQIALGPTGMTEILPDMVLENTNPNGMYLVEVFVNGVNVGNKIDCSHIGKNVVVKVTDLCSGVFCTTTVTVVDNLAPKLTCTDVVLVCAVTNYTPAALAALGIPNVYPDVDENCGQYTLAHSDTWHDLTCADTYIGYARRVWTATDAGGLKGTCVQFVYFEQKGVEDLSLPGDVTLDCNNGPVNTTPAATGAPYLTAYDVNFPIYPNAGFCRLSATFVDNKLPSCEGTYDIIRTWTIYDWCKPTTPTPPSTNPLYHIQVIRVIDKTGPELDCPADLTVGTDPLNCCATVDLPDMIIRDGCSSIRSATARVEVRHPITGDVIAIYDVPGVLVDFPGNNPLDPDTLAVFGFTPCLPQGTHTVTYHVEDNCNNTSNCTFNLTVQDLAPPVPGSTRCATGARSRARSGRSTAAANSSDLHAAGVRELRAELLRALPERRERADVRRHGQLRRADVLRRRLRTAGRIARKTKSSRWCRTLASRSSGRGRSSTGARTTRT
jgi:hypothetical protein